MGCADSEVGVGLTNRPSRLLASERYHPLVNRPMRGMLVPRFVSSVHKSTVEAQCARHQLAISIAQITGTRNYSREPRENADLLSADIVARLVART